MTADEAFALGVADAKPLSQEAADAVAAILFGRRRPRPQPQAA